MFTWGFSVQNTTGSAASDVHLLVRGSGGSLQNARIVHEPAGSNGQASVNQLGQNEIDIVWPTPAITAGKTVVVLVDTLHLPIDLDSTVWTLNDEPIQEMGKRDGQE